MQNAEQRDFTPYIFSARQGYDESAVRAEFAGLMPLKTIAVYCFDPRAADIPYAVAKEFGDVYPGEPVKDDAGNDVATTATLLNVVVAGGRAMDAMRSVTVGQHLFGVENIVVVHHTHCGATSYTAEGIVDAFKHEHGADIADLYPAESVCITDFNESLSHDVGLLRRSPGVPPQVNIYGYVYDIDTGEMIKVVEDRADRQTAA